MKTLNKIARYIRCNKQAILTGFSLAGVCLTAVESSKSAFEIAKLEDVTAKDAVKSYIPTVIVAGITGCCIIKNYKLTKKQIAGLTATVVAANKKLTDYKHEVAEVYGKDACEDIETNLREKEVLTHDPEDDIEGSGPELFFDEFTHRYFRSSWEDVKDAEYSLNRYFCHHDYVNLSKFYDYLGLETDPITDNNGWNMYIGYEIEHYQWIDFVHFSIEGKDGEICNIIGYHNQPTPRWLS